MPHDLTPEERAYALKRWEETFWLEKEFWDWYKTQRPEQSESKPAKKKFGSLLSEGW